MDQTRRQGTRSSHGVQFNPSADCIRNCVRPAPSRTQSITIYGLHATPTASAPSSTDRRRRAASPLATVFQVWQQHVAHPLELRLEIERLPVLLPGSAAVGSSAARNASTALAKGPASIRRSSRRPSVFVFEARTRIPAPARGADPRASGPYLSGQSTLFGHVPCQSPSTSRSILRRDSMTLRTWKSVWARASLGRTQSPTTFAHSPNAIAASSSLVTRSAIWETSSPLLRHLFSHHDLRCAEPLCWGAVRILTRHRPLGHAAQQSDGGVALEQDRAACFNE